MPSLAFGELRLGQPFGLAISFFERATNPLPAEGCLDEARGAGVVGCHAEATSVAEADIFLQRLESSQYAAPALRSGFQQGFSDRFAAQDWRSSCA